ncbi:MAG: hypothetical protein QXT13_10100 [Pyrobaculum sp.]
MIGTDQNFVKGTVESRGPMFSQMRNKLFQCRPVHNIMFINTLERASVETFVLTLLNFVKLCQLLLTHAVAFIKTFYPVVKELKYSTSRVRRVENETVH